MRRLATICALFSCLGSCSQASGQSGIITTVAGSGPSSCDPGYCGRFSGDGGPATSALLNGPISVSVDASGNLFIADTYNNRVRKVSSSGIITTLAGNGNYIFSGDGGSATSASLSEVFGIAVDASGNLFIADSTNNRIRKVSASGIITTIAGSGPSCAAGYAYCGGFSGDGGPATSASLNEPFGVAVDASGNLFIADSGNNRIRRVSASGIITTIAGSGPSCAYPDCGGFSGDGGPATSASLDGPTSIALDASGNLFIADASNNRVRKVSADGTIATVAGIGSQAFCCDGGPATSAALDYPSGVAVDASGNLFIADRGNNRIRKVSAGGIITTVAGYGGLGFSGDGGSATSASLEYPSGVAADASGNLFIADSGNNRVREVSTPGASSPSVPATGVTDGAGFSPRISGGGIGSIFGTNLAAAITLAPSLPLPTTLNNTTVKMNGIFVPLFFVSPLQINFQVPWQLLSSSTAALTVSTALGTSPSITVSLSLAAPGIFTISTANSVTQGAIQIANTTTFVAPVGAIPGQVSRPAAIGDILTIYCSGLGAVTNTPASGSAAGGGVIPTQSKVQAPVSVTIGGQAAPVLFAGLAPTFVGLYQVNVQFPPGVASGTAVPVIVTTASLNSNTATIAVQ